MSSLSEGWTQINAGIALIDWSGLAKWKKSSCIFLAANSTSFEELAGTRDVSYGRVLSWIVFSAGCEYLIKGLCIVRKLMSGKSKPVLRTPEPTEDLKAWIAAALIDAPSVRSNIISYGTLGEIPIDQLLDGDPKADLSKAAFKLLRQRIRNRDMHIYQSNVRASHFHIVSQSVICSCTERTPWFA